MTWNKWSAFLKQEWLLVIAGLGLVFTSLYLRRVPSYSKSDIEILFILFVLFVITAGLQQHDVIANIATRLEGGRFVAGKMIVATFFFSMFVTNDVALISIVPLTMLLNLKYIEWVIILEALAANAGSALSPFGNPQNLFIYWFYNVPFSDFVKTIAPFSALFFFLLLLGAFLIESKKVSRTHKRYKQLSVSAYIYIAMLFLFILTVLRLLPLYIGFIVILFAIFFDRGSLKVDFALLATFAFFFGFTDNLRIMLSHVLAHPHHVFLLAAFLSQIISNVPAALLLTDFTQHWDTLLWGVSVGGFGSLVASLANLIAYRIFIRKEKEKTRSFTIKFHTLSYLAFAIGILLYFFLYIAA